MRWRRVIAAAVAASLQLAAAAADERPPALAALERAKVEIARELVVPIEACVRRSDTGHAAFRGCIDWHSAVHGTWALIAYMRATGEAGFDDLVRNRVLTPAAVAEERRLLERRPRFEMPYGRAWFLRLAIDYEKRYGDGRLTPMAEAVADSLVRHLAQRRDPYAGSYGSLSWAVINLLDYSHFTADPKREATALGLARRLLEDVLGPCPLARERGHFMAVCTNLAAVAARVMPAEAFAAWLARAAPAPDRLEPVTRPATVHHAGLNFSRAWGLWQIYAASGDPRWAAAYADHFAATYSRPGHWRGDYRRVGHWVAQFGLYALQPLFGPERGR